jgi:hypothetical protein
MRRLVACLWILAAVVAAANGAVSLGRAVAMAREPRAGVDPIQWVATRIRAQRPSNRKPILFIAPQQNTRNERYEALRTELRLKYLLHPIPVDIATLPLLPDISDRYARIVALSCPPDRWPRGARLDRANGQIAILELSRDTAP